MTVFDFERLFVIALFVGSSLLAPFVALTKRYKPWFWLLACGPIGLLTILCLPSLKVAKDPEEYEWFESRANWIGSILSSIALFIGFIPLFVVLNKVLAPLRGTSALPAPTVIRK